MSQLRLHVAYVSLIFAYRTAITDPVDECSLGASGKANAECFSEENLLFCSLCKERQVPRRIIEHRAFKVFNLKVNNDFIKGKRYSAVISLVAHKRFVEMDIKQWKVLMKKNCILFDLKGFMPRELKPLRI